MLMIRHLSNSLHSAVVKLMKTWGFIFYFLNYTVTAVTSPTAALFPPPSLLRWCHTVVCGVSVVSLWSVVCLWLHCGLLPVVHLAKSQILDSNIVILYWDTNTIWLWRKPFQTSVFKWFILLIITDNLQKTKTNKKRQLPH